MSGPLVGRKDDVAGQVTYGSLTRRPQPVLLIPNPSPPLNNHFQPNQLVVGRFERCYLISTT
jgi:hypothetical protein